MILNEIFDSPVSYEVEVDDDETFTVSTEIEDRTIVFYALKMEDQYTDEQWMVSFVEKGDDSETIKMTGSGGEFKVMGVALKFMRDLESKHRPEIISFWADKGDRSRASVYKKLAERHKRSYDLEIKDEDDKTVFYLRKK